MGEYKLSGCRIMDQGTQWAHKFTVFENAKTGIYISEPDPEADYDEETRKEWEETPCKITLSDGKMASRGGWGCNIEVYREDCEHPYILREPTVGPMSFLPTSQDRKIEDIDENEDSIYGELKRAFLWAEEWSSEHYPGYTILPKSMRNK